MMNVSDFLNEFTCADMNVEVVLGKPGGENKFIYVGSPTNYDAFIKHMKHFKDTCVVGVHARGDKLIINATQV